MTTKQQESVSSNDGLTLTRALNEVIAGIKSVDHYQIISDAGIEFIGPGIWYYSEGKRMNIDVAKEILTQAKSDGTYGGSIPADDNVTIREAEDLVALARQAYKAGVKGPSVTAIINIAENNGAPREKWKVTDQAMRETAPYVSYDTDRVQDIKEAVLEELNTGASSQEDGLALIEHVHEYEDAHKQRMRILEFTTHLKENWKYEEKTHAPPETETKVSEENEDRSETLPEVLPPKLAEEPTPVIDSSDGEGPEQDDEIYRELIDTVDDDLKREHLQVPQKLPPEEDQITLPFDWTTLSALELQQAYSAFSTYAYRTNYLMMREEARGRLCRQCADEIKQELIVKTPKYDEKGHERKIAHIEAEIESDANVKLWRARQHKHEVFATAYKSERDGYNKTVESLSRLETMRHNEWERSR